jgi:hypothetical protein
MVFFRHRSALRVIRERTPLTNGTWMVTGGLGLMLFLTAGASDAQERSRQDPKPFSGSKRVASALEPKPFFDPKATAAAAAFLESAYEGDRPPEGVRMLAAILRGSQMGPGEGWFGLPIHGIPGNGSPAAAASIRARAAFHGAVSAGRRPGLHAWTATRTA